MRKLSARELLMLLIPALSLLLFGGLMNNERRDGIAPRLTIQSTSIVATGFMPKASYAQPDKRLKVLLRYNPRTWLESWKPPKLAISSTFDLLDEGGRKYAVTRWVTSFPKGRNQYEIDCDYPLYQVIRQMPPNAKRIILKTKVTCADGWTLPVSVVLYRRN